MGMKERGKSATTRSIYSLQNNQQLECDGERVSVIMEEQKKGEVVTNQSIPYSSLVYRNLHLFSESSSSLFFFRSREKTSGTDGRVSAMINYW